MGAIPIHRVFDFLKSIIKDLSKQPVKRPVKKEVGEGIITTAYMIRKVLKDSKIAGSFTKLANYSIRSPSLVITFHLILEH